MTKLLDKNPEKRATLQELIDHEWVNNEVNLVDADKDFGNIERAREVARRNKG